MEIICKWQDSWHMFCMFGEHLDSVLAAALDWACAGQFWPVTHFSLNYSCLWKHTQSWMWMNKKSRRAHINFRSFPINPSPQMGGEVFSLNSPRGARSFTKGNMFHSRQRPRAARPYNDPRNFIHYWQVFQTFYLEVFSSFSNFTK